MSTVKDANENTKYFQFLFQFVALILESLTQDCKIKIDYLFFPIDINGGIQEINTLNQIIEKIKNPNTRNSLVAAFRSFSVIYGKDHSALIKQYTDRISQTISMRENEIEQKESTQPLDLLRYFIETPDFRWSLPPQHQEIRTAENNVFNIKKQMLRVPVMVVEYLFQLHAQSLKSNRLPDAWNETNTYCRLRIMMALYEEKKNSNPHFLLCAKQFHAFLLLFRNLLHLEYNEEDDDIVIGPLEFSSVHYSMKKNNNKITATRKVRLWIEYFCWSYVNTLYQISNQYLEKKSISGVADIFNQNRTAWVKIIQNILQQGIANHDKSSIDDCMDIMKYAFFGFDDIVARDDSRVFIDTYLECILFAVTKDSTLSLDCLLPKRGNFDILTHEKEKVVKIFIASTKKPVILQSLCDKLKPNGKDDSYKDVLDQTVKYVYCEEDFQSMKILLPFGASLDKCELEQYLNRPHLCKLMKNIGQDYKEKPTMMVDNVRGFHSLRDIYGRINTYDKIIEKIHSSPVLLSIALQTRMARYCEGYKDLRETVKWIQKNINELIHIEKKQHCQAQPTPVSTSSSSTAQSSPVSTPSSSTQRLTAASNIPNSFNQKREQKQMQLKAFEERCQQRTQYIIDVHRCAEDVNGAINEEMKQLTDDIDALVKKNQSLSYPSDILKSTPQIYEFVRNIKQQVDTCFKNIQTKLAASTPSACLSQLVLDIFDPNFVEDMEKHHLRMHQLLDSEIASCKLLLSNAEEMMRFFCTLFDKLLKLNELANFKEDHISEMGMIEKEVKELELIRNQNNRGDITVSFTKRVMSIINMLVLIKSKLHFLEQHTHDQEYMEFVESTLQQTRKTQSRVEKKFQILKKIQQEDECHFPELRFLSDVIIRYKNRFHLLQRRHNDTTY